MASSHVGVATDGPGKGVETVALTSDEAGNPTTQRQVVTLGDATTFANKAKVDASGNLATAIPDGANVVQGSTTDTSSSPTLMGKLLALLARFPASLGQKLSASSLAVVIASDQSAVPVSGAVSVSNLPGTQPVSGSVSVSNLPGTQPVSGTVAVSSLPGSAAQDGTDSSDVNATQATGGVGLRGWASTLVSLFRSGAAKVTINGTPAVTVSGSVATTLSGTPAVSVSNLPVTQPISGTIAVSGTVPTSVADGADTALGATGDLATANTLIGRVKNLLTRIPTGLGQQTSAGSLGVVVASDQSAIPVSGAVSVSNFPATQPVSGTVAVSGTTTISGAVTNSNLDVALSTRLKPADTLAGVTTVGAVTAITNALPTGANTIGAVTNANLDVALSTRLKPADTLAGVTTVAAVTAITNALPAGTNTLGAVKQATQASLTATLATNVTGNSSTTGQSLDGYDGAATIELVAVGTGTQAVSLQIEGSLDNSNWYIVGTAQVDGITNPVYAAANFTLTLIGGATQRHLYALRDTVKYVRITTTANNLATGLSSTLYTNPV